MEAGVYADTWTREVAKRRKVSVVEEYSVELDGQVLNEEESPCCIRSIMSDYIST